MKLYGHEVEQEWIHAALGSMEGSFTFRHVAAAAICAGCPVKGVPTYGIREEWFAYRVADRILKKEKRAGRIAYNKQERVWQKL